MKTSLLPEIHVSQVHGKPWHCTLFSEDGSFNVTGETGKHMMPEKALDRARYAAKSINNHANLVAALEAIVKITDGSQPIDYPGALMVARSALKMVSE